MLMIADTPTASSTNLTPSGQISRTRFAYSGSLLLNAWSAPSDFASASFSSTMSSAMIGCAPSRLRNLTKVSPTGPQPNTAIGSFAPMPKRLIEESTSRSVMIIEASTGSMSGGSTVWPNAHSGVGPYLTGSHAAGSHTTPYSLNAPQPHS